MNHKIFITGGSGFIGTNMVEYLVNKGQIILNYDIKAPKDQKNKDKWIKGNILDYEKLNTEINSFQPDYVIHLAARTDLDEKKDINGYETNIKGVENIVSIINKYNCVKRVIYASSRMVCRIDYIPNSFDDYCPPNLYGESKVLGEKIVKNSAKHDYVILRPTSIWGPYFEIPYKTFFDTVKKGLFFLPKNHNPQKSFGFVYNTVYQIDKVLFASKDNLKENYYLSDYPAINLKEWADLVSIQFHNKKSREIPILPLKIASKVGDLLQKAGWKNPPITTFRLNNLITNMEYDTSDLEKLCGELPYNLNDAVIITVDWMKENN